ncbi:MAG: hypothetical protein K6U89_04060 [Chloroflexi bacterium]|nr:hypothetical protein [Chloroflexota bacterium]
MARQRTVRVRLLTLLVLSAFLLPAGKGGALAAPRDPAPTAPRSLAGVPPGWSALGSGVAGSDGVVFALATLDGTLYVGGEFNHAGGVPARNVARWDPATEQWQALGAGVDGIVYALAVFAGELYVGGAFREAGGLPAANIARWNPRTGGWAPLGGGVTSDRLRVNALEVRALAVVGDALYVGGAFSHVNGPPGDPAAIPAQNVARWRPREGRWEALGSGITAGGTRVFSLPVTALAANGTDLYVGGTFSAAGGTPAASIARFRTEDEVWEELQGGVGAGDATPSVLALTVAGNTLYLGGRFATVQNNDQPEPLAAPNFARWDLTSRRWLTVTAGLSGTVHALATLGGEVYATGIFTGTAQRPLAHLARFSPSSGWSPLGPGLSGDAGYALLATGSSLIIGGRFEGAGAVEAANIARLDPAATTYQPLGLGVGDGEVRAIALAGEEVFVGGVFTSAGGVAARNLARWSPSRGWEALGTGVSGPFARVNALALLGDDLYVGGAFTAAGSLAVRNLARWNRTSASWQAVGGGVGGGLFLPVVNALAVQNGQLYVGGLFSEAGGVPAANVARWEPATARWSALGSGITLGAPDAPAVVLALAGLGPDLYVAGFFQEAGGAPARNLARWDGQRWWPLGAGISGGQVTALAPFGGMLVAGGVFREAGGQPAANLAQWDPASGTWQPLGGGVPEGSISALAVSGEELYVGGNFSAVGRVSAQNVARWTPRAQAWSRLDQGLTGANSFVFALAASETALYAGGSFARAGGGEAASIARYRLDPPEVRNRVFVPLARRTAAG